MPPETLDTVPHPVPGTAAARPEPRGRSQRLRIIWNLAWPVIVTMSIESLVGLVDMVMVGRLGAAAVAGVGVGVQVLNAMTTVMFAVGTGTLAVVARHVGAGEGAAADDALTQSLLAAGVLGTLAAIPVIVWAPAVVAIFGVTPEVALQGAAYVRIVMLGLPADALIFTAAMGLRGAGDTRTPLLIGAVTGATKIAGNYVLIFGARPLPPLGVAGAALASALAFTAGAVVALRLLARGGLRLRLARDRLAPDVMVLRRVLGIGYPAAIEHALTQLGFFLYIIFAARYGTAAVAAYFIGVRILALSFLPGFGFTAAAAALVGQNLGARRPEEAARSGWESVRLAIGLMTSAGVVIYLAARPIARLFVDDPAVIAHAVPFIHVLAVAQPLMAIDFTLGGALRGAGDTRFPLLAVFVAFYGCRLGLASLVTLWWRLDVFWLWCALLADYAARCALKAWRFRSGRWQRIAL